MGKEQIQPKEKQPKLFNGKVCRKTRERVGIDVTPFGVQAYSTNCQSQVVLLLLHLCEYFKMLHFDTTMARYTLRNFLSTIQHLLLHISDKKKVFINASAL